MYVKKKYAHLEADIAEHIKMLQVSNQQLGLAVLQALKERDVAIAALRQVGTFNLPQVVQGAPTCPLAPYIIPIPLDFGKK